MTSEDRDLQDPQPGVAARQCVGDRLGPRALIAHDAGWFAELRTRHAQGHVGVVGAVQGIRVAADRLLGQPPACIVHKTRRPSSGDPHDYMSMGPYWWPNPETPDGLPYVRRDGEKNPESDAFDRASPQAMVETVQTLGLAWHFSHEERYADCAVRWLRVFFLEEATKMNPHLQFGQAVPGRCEGRGIGIIETTEFATVLVDAILLLAGSAAMTDETMRGLRDWFAAYLQWLLESEHGQHEGREHNNHGTAYDLQVAVFARFVGQDAVARKVLRDVPARRIATQVEPDGRQPHELARTRAFSYATMNVGLLCHLATLAHPLGIDLWQYQTADGRGLRRALEWMLPFWTGAEAWTYPQIVPFDRASAYGILRRAARAYGTANWSDAAARLAPREVAALW